MKKIFLSTFAVLVTVVFSSAYALEDKEIRENIKRLGSSEKFVKILAETISKSVPSQIDSETKIVSVVANGNTLNITHEMINAKTKNDIGDKKAISEFIKFQTNKVCTSQLGNILTNEYGVIYHYQYLSSTGINLFVFDIKKSNCLK